MGAMERLRDVLEKSQRATDKVTSIVKHTDAQLLELQVLMGPVRERAASLSVAHKSLTAVRDETRTWLDHLEWTRAGEARLAAGGFDDEDVEYPQTPNSFLRVTAKVAEAEVFFSHQKKQCGFAGAEAGFRKAREVLGKCLVQCETEFATLLRELFKDPARRHHRPSEQSAAGFRVEQSEKSGAKKTAPAPPPPFGTDEWDAHIAGAATSKSPRVQSPGSERNMDRSSVTQENSGTPIRKPEMLSQAHHTHKERKIPTRLSALARTLLRFSEPGCEFTKRTRDEIESVYVDARVYALDTQMGLTSETDARLRFFESNGKHTGGDSNLFGECHEFLAGAARRVLVLETNVGRLENEANVARLVFTGDDDFVDGTDTDHQPEIELLSRLESQGVDTARRVASITVDHSVRSALNWVHALAENAKHKPASLLASLHAKAHLARLRWRMETSCEAEVFAVAFSSWDTAGRTAEQACHVAFSEIVNFVELEAKKLVGAGRVFSPNQNAGFGFGALAATNANADAAAFVVSVAEFLTVLSECDNTRSVLFRETTLSKAKQTQEQGKDDGNDDDGILDFTDDDDEDEVPNSTGVAKPGSRKSVGDEDAAFSAFAARVLQRAVNAIAVVETTTTNTNTNTTKPKETNTPQKERKKHVSQKPPGSFFAVQRVCAAEAAYFSSRGTALGLSQIPGLFYRSW